MNEDPSRKRLGRGLAALIGDMDRPAAPAQTPGVKPDQQIPIELISPNPRNPRRFFDEAELGELAQSIREHGLVQPVLVRPVREGQYELIAGERRWRAAQKAGLTQVPAIVRTVDDRVALELAIVENVQRADLNPVEEALGYQQLMEDHGYTQADLGNVVGKSRSHVANTLRLLKLPPVIHDLINNGSLTAGHARTLVNADDPAGLAKRIVEGGLSVRQAESLLQQQSSAPLKARKPRAEIVKDADTVALEKLLSDITGLAVVIAHKQEGGEVKIAYKSLEQLDDLCRRLRQ
jgi:ParB family chromosome partitioning protein